MQIERTSDVQFCVLCSGGKALQFIKKYLETFQIPKPQKYFFSRLIDGFKIIYDFHVCPVQKQSFAL